MTKHPMRLMWIDVVRSFAIIGVVLVHTMSPLLGNDGVTGVASRAITAIALTCVPIFFMVSGALVLPRAHQQPISKYIFFKPLAIVFLIFLWEFVFRLTSNVLGVDTRSVPATISGVLQGNPSNGVLWYLYRIAGVYLAAPFLAAMVSCSSTKNLVIFVALSLGIEAFFRTISNVFGVTWWIPIDYRIYVLWFGYFVAGYVITHRLSGYFDRPNFWIAIASAGFVLTVVLIQTFRSLKGTAAPLFLGYDEPGIALMSLGVFGLCVSLRESLNNWPAHRLFNAIGATTLGVYLIHELVIRWLRSRFGLELFLVDAFSYAAVAAVCSFAITFALLKVPVIRRFVQI